MDNEGRRCAPFFAAPYNPGGRGRACPFNHDANIKRSSGYYLLSVTGGQGAGFPPKFRYSLKTVSPHLFCWAGRSQRLP